MVVVGIFPYEATYTKNSWGMSNTSCIAEFDMVLVRRMQKEKGLRLV